MTREEREMELWTSVYGMHLHANPKEAADYALDSFRAKFPTEPRGYVQAATCACEGTGVCRQCVIVNSGVVMPAPKHRTTYLTEPSHETDARAGIEGCVDHANLPKVPRPL